MAHVQAFFQLAKYGQKTRLILEKKDPNDPSPPVKPNSEPSKYKMDLGGVGH